MNYLSHHYLVRQLRPEKTASPFFFAGNLLPDLISLAGEGRLRDVRADNNTPLAEGIRLHLDTDARFHAARDFKKAQEEVNALLLDAPFVVPLRRRFFIAHIFVVIALDAMILREHPSVLLDLYEQLSLAISSGLVVDAEEIAGRPLPNLLPTLERFVDSRFLQDYATPEGCGTAIRRICRRAGIEGFTETADRHTLAHLFELWPGDRSYARELISLSPNAVPNAVLSAV